MILVLLGVGSYLSTGRTSVTALIPAFFGAAFLLLAYAARNEAARRHAMHAGMLVALVGFAGTAWRLVGATDFTRPAVLAQMITVLVLTWYLIKGIRSFRDARRARG